MSVEAGQLRPCHMDRFPRGSGLLEALCSACTTGEVTLEAFMLSPQPHKWAPKHAVIVAFQIDSIKGGIRPLRRAIWPAGRDPRNHQLTSQAVELLE